ncbi:MAG: AAA family ATPase [Magnetococcales bacterium]|nr:AAA family ATPase [Magnetococcales bacterium]
MYLNYFGLHSPPFSLTPDTKQFFDGAGRGAVLESLSGAIRSGEGFVKVIGETGSGKTMLCRMLCQRLPDNVQTALLLNPNLPPWDLLAAIMKEFRLPRVPGREQVREQQALLNHLLQLKQDGRQALLIIEEAHCMPVATLEALRLLGNLETGRAKLLQILFFGQSPLDNTLRLPTLAPLRDRITTSLGLPHLSLADTERYLQQRLEAVGYRGVKLFSFLATRTLHRAARGGMRRINLLAYKALQAACTENAYKITNRHIHLALEETTVTSGVTCWHRPAMVAGSVAALLAGGLTLHSWATNFSTGMADHPPQPSRNATLETKATLLRETPETPVPETPPQPQSTGEADQARAPAPLSAPVPQPVLKPDDPLRETILAAHHWLNTGDDAHFTIQTVLLKEDGGVPLLERQLTAMKPPLETIQLKIFRLHNGSLLIYMNEFNTMQEAMEAMNRLPGTLKASQPRIRTLERVKSTIRKLALATG